MDILQELPVEQWPLLQMKLRALWPLNVPGYYSLHVNLKCPTLRAAFKFKVYCPYGDVDNGFVAVNIKDRQDVIIFSTNEDMSKIEEAILTTKLIDWNKVVYFDLVTSLVLPTLERVRTAMEFEKFSVRKVKMYYLDGTTKLDTQFRLPANTYLSHVKQKHIERVNQIWSYKYSYSYIYFTTLASNGLSYGLYSSDSDELLAWIFINDYNYLCHLYCEENHRRRGYGGYLMYCAVNDLLKDGHDVYGYIVDGNEKPLALFKKFAFKPVDDAAFIHIEKFGNKP